MKWFAHDSDLQDTPAMQGIIAELGFAGYGRAISMLETLAANGGMADNEFRPELPLDKPRFNIEFWARKFQCSSPEAEQVFNTFEKYELILPRSLANTINAPLLKERLDTWTKRIENSKKRKKEPKKEKNTGTAKSNSNSYNNSNRVRSNFEVGRQAPEKAGVEEEKSPLPEPLSGIARFRRIADEYGIELQTAATDEERSNDLERRFGSKTIDAAFRLFLANEENLSVGGDDRKYLISHFFKSGQAEEISDRIKSIIESGFREFAIIQFLEQEGLQNEVNLLTPAEVEWFNNLDIPKTLGHIAKREKTGNAVEVVRHAYCDFFPEFYKQAGHQGTLQDFIQSIGYQEHPAQSELPVSAAAV